jgi:formate C-acetyltransferase
MLRCLEWTLNHGKSRMDGKTEAPDFGDPSAFESYDEVYKVFLQELGYVIDGLMEKNCRIFGTRAAIAPVPLLSALLDGPIETGSDMTQSGAKYITYGLIAEGVSHVIDSLAAIKKIVFEENIATMGELIKALDDNFEGHENLRQKLLAAPKYGRNQKEADETGKRLIDDFAGITAELNKKYDTMIFLPGAGTFSWYIAIGEGCSASPDGRKSGEPVSSNFSPSAGVATRGVTGAILSQASCDMTNLPVGSPNDLRIAGKLVADNGILSGAGYERLKGLLKSFVSLGGNMLTLSVADTSVLRDAQKNPENHRDLRVRMGGWSAYFTMLSPEQQEHHIKKEEEI